MAETVTVRQRNPMWLQQLAQALCSTHQVHKSSQKLVNRDYMRADRGQTSPSLSHQKQCPPPTTAPTAVPSHRNPGQPHQGGHSNIHDAGHSSRGQGRGSKSLLLGTSQALLLSGFTLGEVLCLGFQLCKPASS